MTASWLELKVGIVNTVLFTPGAVGAIREREYTLAGLDISGGKKVPPVIART